MYYSEISKTLHLAYFPIFVLLLILLSNSVLLKVFKATVWRFSLLGSPQDQLKNLHQKTTHAEPSFLISKICLHKCGKFPLLFFTLFSLLSSPPQFGVVDQNVL